MSSVRVNYLWTSKQIAIITSDYSSLFFDHILCNNPKLCVHSAFLFPVCLAGRADILKIISLLFPVLYFPFTHLFQYLLGLTLPKYVQMILLPTQLLGNMALQSQFPFISSLFHSKLLHTKTHSNCINILEIHCTLVPIISRWMHPETYVTPKINEIIWPVISEL